MSYELAFLQALLITVLLECFMAALLKKFFGRRLLLKDNYPRFLIIVALASVLTLPYAWFVLPAFIKSSLTYILVAEISVTLVEALFYRFTLKTPLKTALILSIAANAFSWFIGNVVL
jgi:hypothetical protein